MATQPIEEVLSELNLSKYLPTFQQEYIQDSSTFSHLTEKDLARLIPPLGPRRKLGKKIDVMLGRDVDRAAEKECLSGHWWMSPFARLQSDDPIKMTQAAADMVVTDGGLRLQKGWVIDEEAEAERAAAAAAAGGEANGAGGDLPWGRGPSGPEFVLKMKGLPFRARFDEIAAFFQWANVTIVPRSAFLEVSPEGKKTGVAYVKLSSEEDQKKALDQLYGERFSDSSDRNINLYKATPEEYREARNAVPKMPAGDSHPISRLLKHRQDSRRAKDYDTADQLRAKVDGLGVTVNEDLRTWTRGEESGAWGNSTPSGGADDSELEGLGDLPAAPEAAASGGQDDAAWDAGAAPAPAGGDADW
eukprot:Hpha_TRINITY_DN16194_c6_g3::TRINITY_DN16194_c6_g3_i1::g.7146::m.7146